MNILRYLWRQVRLFFAAPWQVERLESENRELKRRLSAYRALAVKELGK